MECPPGQTEFLVSVPPGTLPGMGIQTATPDGQVITFLVPADFIDGQIIPIFYTPLQGRAPTSQIGVEPPPAAARPPKSKAEIRMMTQTFADSKDRWKIDGQTMKGFYLRSETGYLYSWDQASGTLYEYEQSDGQCHVIWKAALPSVNAEIWTVLPLPPTDPAALAADQAKSGEVPNMDAFIILTIAHESGKQLPRDVLEPAIDEFCSHHALSSRASQRLRKLQPAAQHFLLQNFRSDEEPGNARSEAFLSYVDRMLRRPKAPWGGGACTLVVHSGGAIIGRCCPDIDALCRDDPPKRLAQAHCKIKSDRERFFVSDTGSSEDGTTLDGFVVGEQWIGPLKNDSLLSIGPLRIKIMLSDMAKDTPIAAKRSAAQAVEDEEWQKKVYQVVKKEERALTLKQQQDYKDRAGERRSRTKGEAGSVAIDSLINKFNVIRQAELNAQEAEDARVDMPVMEAQREANMGTDGSFLGSGDTERAGIGFHSGTSAELIPNVLDPRKLSTKDKSQLKTQMRFEQLNRPKR